MFSASSIILLVISCIWEQLEQNFWQHKNDLEPISGVILLLVDFWMASANLGCNQISLCFTLILMMLNTNSIEFKNGKYFGRNLMWIFFDGSSSKSQTQLKSSPPWIQALSMAMIDLVGQRSWSWTRKSPVVPIFPPILVKQFKINHPIFQNHNNKVYHASFCICFQ